MCFGSVYEQYGIRSLLLADDNGVIKYVYSFTCSKTSLSLRKEFIIKLYCNRHVCSIQHRREVDFRGLTVVARCPGNVTSNTTKSNRHFNGALRAVDPQSLTAIADTSKCACARPTTVVPHIQTTRWRLTATYCVAVQKLPQRISFAGYTARSNL